LRAKYYISFDIGVTYSEFYPTNVPRVSLEQESDECFFRWKIDSFKIGATKNSSVYVTLDFWFFDPSKFLTDIKYKIEENGTVTNEFISSICKGTIDQQNSIYTITPDPDDLYREILLKYNTKYEDLFPQELFGIYGTFHYPVLNTNNFVNVDLSSFSDVSYVATWTSTFQAQSARNTLVTPITTGAAIQIFISNFSGNSFYLGLLDNSLSSASGTVLVTGNGKYSLVATDPAYYIQMIAGVIGSGSFGYKNYYPESKNSGDLLYNILESVINGQSYMDLSHLGLTIKSTILWNDALGSDPPESIKTYLTANPTNDYVIENSAFLNNIWLARGDAFSTTKNSSISYAFKDIMFILRKLRLWWFIDEDGCFRIEHEKYLRSYQSQFTISSAYEVDNRIYTNNFADSFNQVNYTEKNESNEDWLVHSALFPVDITTSRVNDINFSNLITDVGALMADPSIMASGLILLYLDSTNTIQYDSSVLTPANFYLNTKFSWAWLMTNYYDYFAEAKDGTIINGTAKVYAGVKEYLQQSGVRFYHASLINWMRPIGLTFTPGWLTGATRDPETGFYTINVGFDPYNNYISTWTVDNSDITADNTVVTVDNY
jgi:hypothetical protein